MKKLLVPTMALLMLCNFGCARYVTVQKDYSYEYNEKNNRVYPVRKIATKVKTSTFADSKSQLANSKTTQTDKTQSATLGSLNQESQVTTNTVNIIGSMVEGAVKGVLGAMGKPVTP
jgi:hypothetical protein